MTLNALSIRRWKLGSLVLFAQNSDRDLCVSMHCFSTAQFLTWDIDSVERDQAWGTGHFPASSFYLSYSLWGLNLGVIIRPNWSRNVFSFPGPGASEGLDPVIPPLSPNRQPSASHNCPGKRPAYYQGNGCGYPGMFAWGVKTGTALKSMQQDT